MKRPPAADTVPSPSAKFARRNAASESEMPAQRILRFGIDYGTVNLKAAFNVALPGERACHNSVFSISFDKGGDQCSEPMEAGWLLDGKTFQCGRRLQDSLQSGAARHQDVVRLIKLALYEDYKTSDLVEDIHSQLQESGSDLTHFIAGHLKVIFQDIIAHIKRTFLGSNLDVDNMPKEVYISIPQNWTPTSSKIMTDAARMAGLPKTQLVPEPLCAAAHANEDMRVYGELSLNTMQYSELEAGDVIQVADIGGGTADFSSYMLTSKSNEGAQAQLKAVGTPEGVLAGSEFINLKFLKWMSTCTEIVQRGGLQQNHKRLGLTPLAFRAKASAAFDTYKHLDKWPEYYAIFFHGAGTAKWETVLIMISCEIIQGWFDELIDGEIIPAIERQRKSVGRRRTKIMVVPGGFGNSRYLMQKLQDKYDPQDRDVGGGREAPRIRIYDKLRVGDKSFSCVPSGILLRFDEIISDGLPLPFTFGIAQVEPYDEILHPDATHEKGHRLSSGRRTTQPEPDLDLVMRDCWESDVDIVEDRWVTLVKKGTLYGASVEPQDDLRWQTNYIDRNTQASFRQTIYWTAGDIEDHAPVFDRSGKLVPGIKPWTETPLDFDPQAHGFELEEVDDGKWAYQIHWALKLEFQGAGVKVRWLVMKPRFTPFNNDGTLKSRVRFEDGLKEETLLISGEAHNPFVREV